MTKLLTKKYLVNRQTPLIRKRWGRKLTLLLLIVLLIIWSIEKLQQPRTFPVRVVKIIAPSSHLDHHAIQQIMMPCINKGMLWLDAPLLKQTLTTLPWIDRVTLKRHWPDQIIVTITPQIPIARWNQHALLNQKQQIFDPGLSLVQRKLPWLQGPDDRAAMMWQGYLELNRILAPLRLSITHLTLNHDQDWSLVLNNHLKIILGNKDIPQRLTHFVKLYPTLFASVANAIIYVDLRYRHGFAVKWHASTTNNVAVASS